MSDTERLPCKLTNSQIREQGERLAALRIAMGKVESEKKVALAEFKERLDDLGKECATLTQNIYRREEWRVVEVREQRDFALGMVRTIRLDTGETVRSREMTDTERQRHIWDIPDMRPVAEEADEDESDNLFDDEPEAEDVPVEPTPEEITPTPPKPNRRKK